jgi:two-component system, NarL family, sensor histidine kinase EvgS
VNAAKKPARILVVDDEERNRRLLVAMLEAENYTALEAADGAQALELVRQNPPDMVLLDIMMPGMDGYAVVRALRADAATQLIPVVLVTALHDKESWRRGMEAGASDFLTKPVDRVRLGLRIRNLLKLGDYSNLVVQREQETRALMADLTRARDEAQSANRAKDSFLATMSHEIRTPLGGLMGMLELLSMSPLADEQRETLETACDSGRSLLRILNDILDWSKIQEGKLDLAPQATSIAGLLAEVANTYAHVASGNSVTLAQQVDERLSPALMVDPLRLSQVLNNFVSNAVKFSRRGGRVELRAELIARSEGAEAIRFSVKDTGIGIDLQAQSRLFQSYGQASADTARMYGGTGLGLAICRRLADLMDGRIDVASEPGRGSTFSITLTLPLARTGVEPRRDRATIAAAASAWPLVHGAAAADAPLVLVVDDHPVNRKLLARQLGLLGLRVETAQDGKEALPLWRDGRYALVITDCHMPQLDGYELTYAIRGIEADQARARTPIFAWTANALADEIEKCEAAGMDELLVKPADLAQLQRMLEKWLPTAARAASDQPEAAPAPAPQAAAAPPPLDLKHLTAMCGGDSAAVRESLLEFRRTNEQDAVQLRQAVAQDDLERVAHATHRMLGSGSIVGAQDLARTCRHINHAGRAGDSETVAEGMQALEHEVQRLNAYIDSLCAH